MAKKYKVQKNSFKSCNEDIFQVLVDSSSILTTFAAQRLSNITRFDDIRWFSIHISYVPKLCRVELKMISETDRVHGLILLKCGTRTNLSIGQCIFVMTRRPVGHKLKILTFNPNMGIAFDQHRCTHFEYALADLIFEWSFW